GVAADICERRDVTGLGELTDPDAVDADDVRTATGLQVQGDLGLVVLVVHTLGLEGDGDVLAVVGHRLLELGDHPLVDPVRLGLVLPAGDRVGDDRQRGAVPAAVLVPTTAARREGEGGDRHAGNRPECLRLAHGRSP